MEQYKREFIEFMVESDVLKFGEFTLKSGRKSPFFMNAGAYVTGSLFFYNLFRNLALDFQSTAVMAYPFHNPRYISSQPVLHLLILLIP